MMSPTITRDYQPSDLEPVAELWFASWATTGLAFADGISVAGNAIRIEAEIRNCVFHAIVGTNSTPSWAPLD